jgi:sugar O-acyltransferase (sialic acid O-acetyltransferase NeuD family)
MNKIVIVGGGGHAKVLISMIKKLGRYTIAGYTDPDDRGSILGVRYLGDDDILEEFAKQQNQPSAALGIGHMSPRSGRAGVIGRIAGCGFDFPHLISPDSIVNEAVALGRGTVVLDGAVINSGAFIGEWAIVNTRAVVEHDCRIGRNVHVAPGAVICGGAVIGDDTVIGAGAVIKQYVNVHERCMIGAGAVVLSDIGEPGVFAGVPAKRIAPAGTASRNAQHEK